MALTRKLRAPLQKKLRAQLERLTGARSAPVAPVHTVPLDAKTNRISFENRIIKIVKIRPTVKAVNTKIKKENLRIFQYFDISERK